MTGRVAQMVTPAVSELDLSVSSGQVYGFLGPTGAALLAGLGSSAAAAGRRYLMTNRPASSPPAGA